jgi:ribonuclease HI
MHAALEADKDAWVVFTDGACRGNPGPAGAAAVLVDRAARHEATRGFARSTNNVAELTGLLLGLGLLREAHARAARRTWVVYTDSQYARNVVMGTWKARANQGLVQEVRDAVAAAEKELCVRIELRWCPAHCGLEWNEKADRLSVQAAASAGMAGKK